MKYSYLVIYFIFMVINISEFPKVYSYWEVLLTYFLLFFIVHFSCYFFDVRHQFQDVPSVYGVTTALALVLNHQNIVILSYNSIFIFIFIFIFYVFMAYFYLSLKLGSVLAYSGIKADIKFMLSSMAFIVFFVFCYSFFVDFDYDFFGMLIVLPVLLYCTFVFIIYLCVGRGKATPLN